VAFIALARMAVAERGDYRVRWSLLALLGAIAVGTGIGYGSYWFLLFILVAMACAVALPAPGPAMVGFLGTTVVLTVIASHDPHVSSYASSAAMSGFIVWLMRRLFGTISVLQQVRQELALSAVADERLRFARDLHDLLGHTLSLIVVKSEVVRRLAHSDPDAAAQEAADIETVGRTALTEIRQAVSGYREQGLAAELEQAQRALSAAGVVATVRTSGAPYPQAVDVVAGWLVREGVTNVIRHSRARRCDIEVRRVGEEIVATVQDDGIGARTGFSAGNGLTGLTERAESVGGRVTSRSGRLGFRLEAVMPAGDA
jgi:two-component system sensor histidine kinase DesK